MNPLTPFATHILFVIGAVSLLVAMAALFSSLF